VPWFERKPVEAVIRQREQVWSIADTREFHAAEHLHRHQPLRRRKGPVPRIVENATRLATTNTV